MPFNFSDGFAREGSKRCRCFFCCYNFIADTPDALTTVSMRADEFQAIVIPAYTFKVDRVGKGVLDIARFVVPENNKAFLVANKNLEREYSYQYTCLSQDLFLILVYTFISRIKLAYT